MISQKIFAIGDIHGCADELEELIAQLPLDSESTLVFLGDYVDRGPHSKRVIQKIIDLKSQYQVHALMGNHESMMLEFFKDPSSSLAGYFILNGGSSTLASYVTEGNNYTLPNEHLQFLQELPIYYETDKYFFVHAGVPNVKLKNIDLEKHRNELLWVRDSFFKSWHRWEKLIVHGHTPRPDVEVTRKRVNLDTGCVYQGFLSAMEMDSKKIYQVKANERMPHTFLKENPQISRVAKRFLGAIPVFVQAPGGFTEFTTINYNEFGLLIVDQQACQGKVFEVGQILKGKIGDLSKTQIEFVGQVVRHQKRGEDIAYGIKMIEPLGRKTKLT